MDDARTVTPFVNLDDADKDRRLRGACILFDLHGLWWSVPTELTVHEVNRQVMAELARMELTPFRHEPMRARLDRPIAASG